MANVRTAGSGQFVDELILTVRGRRVILAGDLAGIYGVDAKRLNEQVHRRSDRFPADFVFRLDQEEFEALRARGTIGADGRVVLRSQNATLKRGQHVKYPPYAFTEHGAIMAAMVLSSPQAVSMSVYVVRAFTQMRERLVTNAAILKRLAEIDGTLLRHDAALRDIYRKLLPLLQPPPEPPKRRIGFHSSVMFERRPGYFRETSNPHVIEKVDEKGKVLGFSVMRVSALHDVPMEVAL